MYCHYRMSIISFRCVIIHTAYYNNVHFSGCCLDGWKPSPSIHAPNRPPINQIMGLYSIYPTKPLRIDLVSICGRFFITCLVSDNIWTYLPRIFSRSVCPVVAFFWFRLRSSSNTANMRNVWPALTVVLTYCDFMGITICNGVAECGWLLWLISHPVEDHRSSTRLDSTHLR